MDGSYKKAHAKWVIYELSKEFVGKFIFLDKLKKYLKKQMINIGVIYVK